MTYYEILEISEKASQEVIHMAYKALYRTYRPQTFEEMAGQKHILRTLQNAIKENKIAQKILFIFDQYHIFIDNYIIDD